ncbi:DUF6545 domain-containing protein [Streptomyces sp. NPDC021080]|uniref:DUF6545 domain-containing protein n=1 Tax=Streptomyces sp. NPDC021080 TaxID=3365110 RepID=UPI0037A341FD
MTGSTLFSLAAVAPLTFETIRRLPSALRNEKSRSLWVFLAVLDLTLILRMTSVLAFVHGLSPDLDIVVLLARHLLSFLAVGALIQLVTVVVPGRMDGRPEPAYRRVITNRPRRAVTWIAVITSSLTLPLAMKNASYPSQSDGYLFLQAGHFGGSMSLILFYAYMIFGGWCATMMLSAASYDQKSPGAFKLGLQGMALGCVCGVMYAAMRMGYLVTRLFDKPFLGGDGFVQTFSYFAITACALLILAGSSAPMWERMGQRVRLHAAVNDLRPMWCTITYAVPSVVYRSRRERWFIRVVAPRSPRVAKSFCKSMRALIDFWTWTGLERRLHRRVTEICDAAIRLQGYLPGDLHDQTAETAQELGLPAHTVPAYLLHEAMHRMKTGAEARLDRLDRPILEPADSPLETTAALLPIGKALASPVTMGCFNRRRVAA